MERNNSTHEMLIKRGIRLHERFRYKEALALFQKAFERAPNCPAAIYNLANTLYMLDREIEAQTLLSTLIRMTNRQLALGCSVLNQPESFKTDAFYLMFLSVLSAGHPWSKALPFANRHLRSRRRGLKSAWTVKEIHREMSELENQARNRKGSSLHRKRTNEVRPGDQPTGNV